MSAEAIFPAIPPHWKVVTLGDLAESSGGGIQTGPFGSQLHADDYVGDGVPSIMPKNITIDTVFEDDIVRVSPEDVERLAKYKVHAGDIVYSRRGDVEKCVRITPKEDGWLCGTGCLRVRVLPSEVSAEYLHAYLCHPLVREWIVRHAVGATMPNLNTSILSALPVVVPSKQEMEVVSSIWLSISEKIQLNHQINYTLEQMAQAIFKSWFFDFEPVKAKIAGLEAGGSEKDALLAAMQAISGKGEAQLTRLLAEQPEQYAELRATAELFPSAMQDSELGEIPEGWEAATFGKVFTCLDKHRVPLSKRQREQKQGAIPYYGATSVMDYVDEHIFDGIYLLLGEDGSVLRDDGAPFVQYIWGKSWVNNHAHVLQGSNGVSTEQLMCFISMQNIAAYVTGAVQLKLNQKNMNSIPFIKAPDEVNERFYQMVDPLYAQYRALVDQSATLSALRNTLLPKLLSGELTIPEAEEQVAEVADA